MSDDALGSGMLGLGLLAFLLAGMGLGWEAVLALGLSLVALGAFLAR